MMEHHICDLEAAEEIRRSLGSPGGLGATGRYPRGKIHDADEGEIRIAIAADPKIGIVLIDFGRTISMIGLSIEQASELSALLLDKARAARGIG